MQLLISNLGILAERRMAETLEPYGISLGEYRLLMILLEAGPATASEIMPHITLEQSLVSRRVQHLYKKGLLSRWRSRTDRRKVMLRCTEAGVLLMEELVRPLQELEEELTRGIPCVWLAHATQVIEAMIRNLQSR